MNSLVPIETVHPHETFIKSNLPAWLTQASPGMREILRTSLTNSNQSRHHLKGILDQLKSPEAFARPLLQQALDIKFHGLLSAERSVLFREWKNHHLLGQIRTHARTTEQSLLEAALQNFEISETEEDGMERGSAVYGIGKTHRERNPITPLMFAAFCRSLDLGAQYQRHINAVLDPAACASNAQTHRLFAEHEHNRFEVALHLARLKGDIEDRLYQQLLTLQRDGEHPDMLCNHLTINGVVLPSVLVLHDRTIDRNQLLYIPEDPVTSFHRYPSFDDLSLSLADRLTAPDYLKFFNTLVPLRHQGTLFTVKPAWVDSRPIGSPGQIIPARLDQPVTRTPIQGDVFQAIARRRIEQIKNDARVLAVPTADADLLSRQKRLQHYLDIGKSLVFFAASFIPIVGEVLLVVSAGQIIHSIYNGFAAWSRGDGDQALNELMDIVDNVAFAALTAGAIKASGFTAGLVKVDVRSQGWRLWKPDLAPYRHLSELPEGLQADGQGLLQHAHQRYLKLDDHLHAVRRDPQTQEWQLQHPGDPQAYSPTLLSNGVGGWRQEHEHPGNWDDLKLLKRLGTDAANLDQTAVAPVLHASGVDTATLRVVHQDVVRPPPALRDTVRRFHLAEEINQFDLRRAQGLTVTPLSSLIQLRLVSQLPQWPRGRGLKVIDDQGRELFNHGSHGSAVRVPEMRLRNGKLFDCLEEQLPADEFDALLPADIDTRQGKIAGLAQRLSARAQQQKTQLLAWLEALDDDPDTELQAQLHLVEPELSKSQLEELSIVFDQPTRQRLQKERLLAAPMDWEACQYLDQAQASRAVAGVHLDGFDNPESLTMMLAILERLPGWPAATRLEVRDSSGALLFRAGSGGANAPQVLVREGALFSARDAKGEQLFEPADLPTAIERTLGPEELQTILGQARVSTLKQAIRKASLEITARKPPLRGSPKASTTSSTPGRPFDQLFAEPVAPQGLNLQPDGIFRAPPQPDGSYRYYVLERGDYYQVKSNTLGWQLLDARSRFRAYQPYIRMSAEGGWEIDANKGALLGGMQDSPNVGSSEEFESAQSSSDYESAEDDLSTVVYTRQELAQMRTDHCYQHSQNYLRLYDRANNGRYPLRDENGDPMRIVRMQSIGRSTTSHTTLNKALVMPYIQWQGYENVARLYDEKIEVRPFTAQYQRSPQEASLIGQAMVVAKREVKKGEVLGVYGGELVPGYIGVARQDPYLIDIKAPPLPPPGVGQRPLAARIQRDVNLSGDNVLSRMNTVLEYEGEMAVRQASTGYNVEAAQFLVETQSPSRNLETLRLIAMFASEDIPAGSELRWNYSYDPSAIQNTFNAPKPGASTQA